MKKEEAAETEWIETCKQCKEPGEVGVLFYGRTDEEWICIYCLENL